MRHNFTALALCFSLHACTTVPAVPQPPPSLDNPLTHAAAKESQDVLQRIAFGSCNRQNLPQMMWGKIQEDKPQLFLWTGDAVYADTHDMNQLARTFQQQLLRPEYASFLASGLPVIGVYDDHDFGYNDAGADFPEKQASQQLFLDFIGEPKDSPRRQQAGIYQAYRFGTAGQRIKFVLLDTRYHKQDPGPQADVLGSTQWAWLETQLQTDDAELLILVSSFQVLPTEHSFEKWANFPKARARLIAALGAAKAPNIVVISGDRHIAELTKLDMDAGRSVFELTSSGLTHSYGSKYTDEKNKNSRRVGAVFPGLNYGWLEVQWGGPQPSFTIEARDINKQAVISQTIPLNKGK